MSLLTGQIFDIPRMEEGGHGYYEFGNGGESSSWGPGAKSATSRRNFFQSAARWDSRLDRMSVGGEVFTLPKINMPTFTFSGGRSFQDDADAVEDEDEMDLDDEDEDM